MHKPIVFLPGLICDWRLWRDVIDGMADTLAPMVADLRLDENAARVASPVTYYPSRAVPVITAVGADESAEFRRQSQLLPNHWPHCAPPTIVVPGANHFTIVERLAERRGVLFDALLGLFAGSV